jgi:hypothetical protein
MTPNVSMPLSELRSRKCVLLNCGLDVLRLYLVFASVPLSSMERAMYGSGVPPVSLTALRLRAFQMVTCSTPQAVSSGVPESSSSRLMVNVFGLYIIGPRLASTWPLTKPSSPGSAAKMSKPKVLPLWRG